MRKSPPVSSTTKYLDVLRYRLGSTRTVVDHLEIFLDSGILHVIGPIQIKTLTNIEIPHFICRNETSY